MQQPKPRRVEVEWVDSYSHGSPWADAREVEREADRMGIGQACRSTGFLIHETDDSVTIAQTYTLDSKGQFEEFGHALTIPKFALLSKPKDLRR